MKLVKKFLKWYADNYIEAYKPMIKYGIPTVM